MIIEIATEKAFDKIQYSSTIKTLRNLEVEKNYLNVIYFF